MSLIIHSNNIREINFSLAFCGSSFFRFLERLPVHEIRVKIKDLRTEQRIQLRKKKRKLKGNVIIIMILHIIYDTVRSI